jgi:hypothetical protein
MEADMKQEMRAREFEIKKLFKMEIAHVFQERENIIKEAVTKDRIIAQLTDIVRR